MQVTINKEISEPKYLGLTRLEIALKYPKGIPKGYQVIDSDKGFFLVKAANKIET